MRVGIGGLLLMVGHAAAAQTPSTDPPAIYFEVAGMDRVAVSRDVMYKTATVNGASRGLTLDVYAPPRPARAAPVVVFVHGGLVAGAEPRAKDWPFYQSWGRLAAASGMVGVVLNHRLTTNDNVDEASADLFDAIALIRRRASEFQVDPDRICVAFYSAGGVVAGSVFRDAPPFVKCVVLYYPFLDLEHLRTKTAFREAYPSAHVDSLLSYSPREALGRSSAPPPIFLARAGQDAIPDLNVSIDRFIAAALHRNVSLDLYTHPVGVHGFDSRTRDERTRLIISETLAFFRRHLAPER